MTPSLPPIANLSLDLGTLRAGYASGELTPVAVAEEVWRRCEAHGDPAVWIHRLTREELLAHALRVQAAGPGRQPLYGAFFAIKDNIDLEAVPTTAACPAFAYVPSASADVVRRLLEAGAIPVGKTNLDQFATGLVGVRSPYGVPRNPFHPEAIPGGSSSGSAVAVAAGLVSFSLGTDTAGSGRVPAGLNNLVGLKPTRGALSTRGVVPACRSLDCVSIFALTCADAREVGGVAEGFDPEDPFSRERPAGAAGTGLRGEEAAAGRTGAALRRLGVVPMGQLRFYGDEQAERLFAEAVARAADLVDEVVEIDFAPFAEAAALLYQGPWVAERWAGLRTFFAAHGQAVHPVTRGIIEAAAGLGAAEVFDGFHRLAEVARRAQGEWARMDALLLPTAPRPYTRAQVEAEPLLLNTRLGTYTNFVNLLDLSAVALPAGLRADGIPWGVTLLSGAWNEGALLEWGARWEARRAGTLGATGHARPSAAADSRTGHKAPDVGRGGGAEPAPQGVRLAVVGAHLSGLPLNGQLTGCGARLVWSGRSAPLYRFFALPGTVPPKPGLVRVGAGEGGGSIELEVWEMTVARFGAFVAAIPAPLGVGTIVLEDGQAVKGFLCESIATVGAEDITAFGGWRSYLARGAAGA